jgi:hypothetical protein
MTMADPLHNFVRLRGVVVRIETVVEADRSETDHMLFQFGGENLVWVTVHLIDQHAQRHLRRETWVEGGEFVVLGSLASTGESAYISAFSVYTPEKWEEELDRRKQRWAASNREGGTKTKWA